MTMNSSTITESASQEGKAPQQDFDGYQQNDMVFQSETEKEIHRLRWRIMNLDHKNSILEDKLAMAAKPSAQHATKLQALEELVEDLPSEYKEELKREINFNPDRELTRCLSFVNSMCCELRASVEWYVDKLEQKFHHMDLPEMVQAMRLAAVPDDVICAVTDNMTGACSKASESIQRWKQFSQSLNSICTSQLN